MKARLTVGLAVITLLALGLLTAGSLCLSASVEAQPPSPETLPLTPTPPPLALTPQSLLTPPEAAPPLATLDVVAPPPPQVRPVPPLPVPPEGLLVRFTTTVTPVYEGGAQGMPVPVTVEIRSDELAKARNLRLAAWRRKLPDRIKEAVQTAMDEAAREDSPEDARLDEILDRLERMERRLQRIEEQKAAP